MTIALRYAQHIMHCILCRETAFRRDDSVLVMMTAYRTLFCLAVCVLLVGGCVSTGCGGGANDDTLWCGIIHSPCLSVCLAQRHAARGSSVHDPLLGHGDPYGLEADPSSASHAPTPAAIIAGTT